MKKAKLLTAFTLVLLCSLVNAQSYFFRNYSVEDGLPFINVSAIYQDSNGNLWSGGYGGLSKFDGNTFVNYTPREGLLNHFVTCITEDDQKNLWMGTISGVNKYDGKKFSGYTTAHGLLHNSIKACAKDKDGNLWFGTSKGISKLTDGTFINFTTKNGLIDNNVNCIFRDHNGKIWIGTAGGLSLFDGKKFINYSISQSLFGSVNGITEDKTGGIWLATSDGLYLLKDKMIRDVGAAKGLKQNNLTAILCDYKNTIWLGTGRGIIKFENDTFTHYTLRRDQNSNLISCFFQDYERNLWIGTYAGLFKYRGNPFVNYGIHDGLTSNFIFGVYRDSKGNLWVGSQGGGLYLHDENGFTQFSESEGLKSKTVNSILEYEPGKLWLATGKGLVFFDGRTFSQKKDTTDIFENSLNIFYQDSKGNLWIGGSNKVYKYDGKNFSSYALKTIYDPAEVWAIAEDHEGTIWVGTYLGGLLQMRGNTFVECSKEMGLSNDSYIASLVDKEGNLYFGTLDGVWMFNPSKPSQKPVNFNRLDGMSSDLVYSLTFGKTEDEIWAGTNQGLNHIDLATFKATGKKNIIPFGKQEGFSGVECNSGNFVEPDGSIWFGTVNGLVKYDPNEYIENTSESRISISGFRLFYTDTLLRQNVHLRYSDNNITFIYSGICLTNPSKVVYSHILDGFEKEWSPPSKERLATYSNLPPGRYTFKVISSNNEGVWNSVPATFSFTVERPFWKTWWFLIGSAVVLLCALVFSIRFRIHQIKSREKQKTELNKKIAHIESQALRAQMNPHFIFNTLSSIQHYISNNDTDAALKYLSKFAKLMRKIMDNSKQPLISVAEEINALELYLELEVMRFDKKFEYQIEVDNSIDQNYDRIPSMLIQPYVENAIIHGLLPKLNAGKISIKMHRQDETILCTIEDNGIGRERSKEFKKHRIQQHKSMGMSITQERLAILNSSLNSKLNAEIVDLYEGGQPAGTKVILHIPLEPKED
jgi:ligand-binding sensor domain-containing protein